MNEEKMLKMHNEIKNKLNEFNSISENIENKIETFKYKYAECEIIYKIILSYYKNIEKDDKAKRNLKVNMNQVKPAVKYGNYNIDDDLLKKIFGSSEKVSKRSAKKIRDDLNHSMSKSVINELNTRYSELMRYMDNYLDVIKGDNL